MAPCKRSRATRKTIPHRNHALSGVFDSLVGQQGEPLRLAVVSTVGSPSASPCEGIFDRFHQEVTATGYPYMRPGLERARWDATVMEVIDPFGNRLRFNEGLEGGASGT
jgi:Glyoxalase superfamily protein